jgi:ribonuclease BN (tRNA processing enzyme)
MMSMKVTVMGCAGSFPGPSSPASSYLFEADGFRMVVDMGNGSLGALQNYAPIFGIDAVCLSHLHADHCVDLYSYGIARRIAPGGPQPSIPVYGPAGSEDRIAMVHGPESPGELAGGFDFQTMTPATREIGPFRITTAHMNHPVETFGFRVEHAGRAIAYSADTGPCDALVALARDADVLLSEASFLDAPGLPENLHLSARQAAQHASRAGVGELILTHLVAWNDPLRSVTEASDTYGGKVSAARAGTVIDLQ